MAFRIVEITKPSECHVSNGQLMVEQEDYKVQIPLWNKGNIYGITKVSYKGWLH